MTTRKNAHVVANLQTLSETCGIVFLEGVGLVSRGRDRIDIWSEDADRGVKCFPAVTASNCVSSYEMAGVSGGRLAIVAGGVRGSEEPPTIEVMDARSGQRLHQLLGHTKAILCLAALPGGLLASGGDDNTDNKMVRIWNVDTGAQVGTLEGHTGPVWSLAALPDGLLASGGLDWTLRIWNVATQTQIHLLDCGGNVFSLAVLGGGRLAGGCGLRGRINIWSIADGVKEAVLTGHSSSVTSLALLPGGLLASGGDDATTRVWDVDTRVCLAVLEGHGSALAALPDGRLASGGKDLRIRIWELTDPGSPEDKAAAKKAKALKRFFSPNISVPPGPTVGEGLAEMVHNPMAGIAPTEEFIPEPVEEFTTVKNPMAGIAPTEELLLPPPRRLPPISTPISTVFPNPVALFAAADPRPAQGRFRLPPLGIRLPLTLGNNLPRLPDLKGGKRRTRRKSKTLTKRKNKRKFKRASTVKCRS